MRPVPLSEWDAWQRRADKMHREGEETFFAVLCPHGRTYRAKDISTIPRECTICPTLSNEEDDALIFEGFGLEPRDHAGSERSGGTRGD